MREVYKTMANAQAVRTCVPGGLAWCKKVAGAWERSGFNGSEYRSEMPARGRVVSLFFVGPGLNLRLRRGTDVRETVIKGFPMSHVMLTLTFVLRTIGLL